MDDLESQINARVAMFLEDLATLLQRTGPARRDRLQDPGPPALSLRRRRSGVELARMAEDFIVYVGENPGQRMEHIARALGHPTHALRREVKKLLASGQVRMEGQTRACTYSLPSRPARQPRRTG